MKIPPKVFSIPACALIVLPGVAFAHYPLDWAPVEMFTYGIPSGIVYSVIGFEHLFFVLAAGLAAALACRPYSTPAAYVVAMLGGTVLASTGMGLPIVETVIALSLLCLGGLLVWGRIFRLGTTLGLFAGFGVFHGSAFGESPAAQKAGDRLDMLIGSLLCPAIVQYRVSAASARLAQGWAAEDRVGAGETRLAGSAVTGIGLFLVLETVEDATFTIMGFG